MPPGTDARPAGHLASGRLDCRRGMSMLKMRETSTQRAAPLYARSVATPSLVGQTRMNSENKTPGLIPAVTWLRHYPRQWLGADITAGLVSAAVVIPKAMA